MNKTKVAGTQKRPNKNNRRARRNRAHNDLVNMFNCLQDRSSYSGGRKAASAVRRLKALPKFFITREKMNEVP